MRKLVVCIICGALLLRSDAHAQNEDLTDSLRTVLSGPLPDSTRIALLYDLSWELADEGSYVEAKAHADSMMALATRIGSQHSQANAFNILGEIAQRSADYPEARRCFAECLRLNRKVGSEHNVAGALNNMANVKRKEGDLAGALSDYLAAVDINQRSRNEDWLGKNYDNIGTIYLQLGDHPEALSYMLQALALRERIGDKPGIAVSYSNLGIFYQQQSDLKEALRYTQAALKTRQELDDQNGMAISYVNIANILNESGQHAEALQQAEEAIRISEGIGAKYTLIAAHAYAGQAYESLGKYDEALGAYESGRMLAEAIDDRSDQAELSLMAVALLTKTKRYAEARRHLDTAIPIARTVGSREMLANAYRELERLDSIHGDWHGAYRNHRMHVLYRDSIYNASNTEETTRLELQYEFDKAEAAAQAEQDKRDALSAEELQRKELQRNALLGFGILGIIFAMLDMRRRRRIKQEHAWSEALLLNILPAEVAEELKNTGTARARHFDNATILFTDFKGFTQLSEKVSPAALVAELNTCFKEFDSIMTKHHIEKIKTIGDAYMAAGGLPDPQHGSPSDVVRAALEMQEFMERHKAASEAAGKPFFEMRVGIHSGPVVAGIVGVKKFQYDIWGDTVNTASRMESSGEVGQVNISEITFALVKDEPGLTFTPRGKVQAKGKGEMEMYFAQRISDVTA
ncbi:MAG: tetratricopeptide repeat protein [Flavobacteriales bacterium]|nr:tetratricopeptide repeat protein [Flavobacteriales bacterium]